MPLDKVEEFQTNFLLNIRNKHEDDVLKVLRTGVINDEVGKIIEEVAADVAQGYKK